MRYIIFVIYLFICRSPLYTRLFTVLAMSQIQRKKTLCALILLDMIDDDTEKNERKTKQVWVRSWLAKRKERGSYHTLLRELQNDQTSYR